MKNHKQYRHCTTYLLVLLILPFLSAKAYPANSRPDAHSSSKEELTLINYGTNAIRNKHNWAARQIANAIIANNPKNADAYHLLTMAILPEAKTVDLLRIILKAERNGVYSLMLCQLLAERGYQEHYFNVVLFALEKYEEIWKSEGIRE